MGWVFSFLLSLSTTIVFAADTIPLKKTQPAPAETTAKQDPKKDSKDAKKDGATHADKPYIAAVEAFGSPRLTQEAMKETLGDELDKWFEMGLSGDGRAIASEKVLKDKIRAKFDFAAVDFSILEYFEPGNLAIFVTLDVVEKADVSKRMPFHTAPTAQLPDPEKLLEQWLDYEELSFSLIEKGKLKQKEAVCQAAFHCPFGHKLPELAKYEGIFTAGVKKHQKEILEVLKNDARVDYRASAAYLLPYLTDGRAVVDAMIYGTKDPDPLVRNNSLRVLGEIAELHSEIPIPIEPIVEALNYPRVSDRSKAAYVLHSLINNFPKALSYAKSNAVPSILQLLNSSQPNHWEIAHGLLKKISGKTYPSSDKKAWIAWYEKGMK